MKVMIVINYGGLHIYRIGANPLLLKSFDFHTLVSWQSMNDMLIVNLIHTPKGGGSKRREKLRFITRENAFMKSLLGKYADAVLQDYLKRKKARQAVKAVEEGDDDE